MTLVSIGELARELDVSPSWIRKLTEAGVLTATRTAGGHRRYDLAANVAAFRSGSRGPRDGQDQVRDIVVFDESLSSNGLEEHDVWRSLHPALAIDPASSAFVVARYSFTEMLNNAIDHASASTIRVSAARGPSISMTVEDDGVGAYANLAEGLQLSDTREAVAELTKGKRTTSPEHHTGEGIFFTSKAVQLFRLDANGIAWTVDNLRHDMALGSSEVTSGTRVTMAIDPATTIQLVDLFRRYTHDGDFVRTSPVVRLFETGGDFVSRSEAKRLLTGMEAFTDITIDFAGVTSVGQAFVDEVFRVWPTEHPGVRLTAANMNAEVEFMVERGLPAANT